MDIHSIQRCIILNIILNHKHTYNRIITKRGRKNDKSKPITLFLLNEILKYTEFLNKYNYKFSFNTLCWYYITRTKTIPKCKNCGKEIIRNVLDIYNPNYFYCSSHCQVTSNQFKQKRVETWIKNLGVDSPSKNQKVLEKARQTCMTNFGVEYPMQSKEVFEAGRNKKLERYGDKDYNNRKKNKETRLLKNNGNWDSQESIQLRKSTCNKKYGGPTPMSDHNIRIKTRTKYCYNDINFMNTWELSYYIWLQDNNMCFEYQPESTFKYEYNGNVHEYNPDFKINGEYFELKGDQFFKNHDITKEMINPYDKSHKSDRLYEAKHQCMIKNNVKILTSIDMKPILKYVKDKYGKDYLKQFKRK